MFELGARIVAQIIEAAEAVGETITAEELVSRAEHYVAENRKHQADAEAGDREVFGDDTQP